MASCGDCAPAPALSTAGGLYRLGPMQMAMFLAIICGQERENKERERGEKEEAIENRVSEREDV